MEDQESVSYTYRISFWNLWYFWSVNFYPFFVFILCVTDGNNNDGPDWDSNPDPLNLYSGDLPTELSGAGIVTTGA